MKYFLNILTIICLMPVLAFAQNNDQEEGPDKPAVFQYSDKYKLKSQGSRFVESGLIAGMDFRLKLLPAEGENDQAGDFVLRLFSPVAISGCTDIKNPELETSFAGKVLIVDVAPAAVGVDREAGITNENCNRAGSVAHSDLVLNGPDLQKRGIETIRFQSKETGVMAKLELALNDETASITSQKIYNAPAALPRISETVALKKTR